MSWSVAALEFRKQAQHFEIEPDERDHQAERAVPLHVTWSAHARAGFDHVEIGDEVESGDADDEEAEADADDAAAVDRRNRNVEETQDDLNEIEERDAAGGCDDAELEILRDANRAGFIRDEHDGKHTEGEADGVECDSGIRLVENGGDAAEKEPFEEGVDRRGDRCPIGLKDGGQRGDEAAEDAADHPWHSAFWLRRV